jgi:hypothetical protein
VLLIILYGVFSLMSVFFSFSTEEVFKIKIPYNFSGYSLPTLNVAIYDKLLEIFIFPQLWNYLYA